MIPKIPAGATLKTVPLVSKALAFNSLSSIPKIVPFPKTDFHDFFFLKMAVCPTLALLVQSAPAFLMAPGSVGGVQLGLLEMESIVKTLMKYEHCEEKYSMYYVTFIITWLTECKLCAVQNGS